MEFVLQVCDKYHEVLDMWFYRLNKFWEIDSTKVNVICCKNRYTVPSNNRFPANVIHLGEDFGWSANMLKVFPQLPECFLFTLEDFFIDRTPDMESLEKLWKKFLQEETIALFSLKTNKVGKKLKRGALKMTEDGFVIHQSKSLYCVHLQLGFWRKRLMAKVLRPVSYIYGMVKGILKEY